MIKLTQESVGKVYKSKIEERARALLVEYEAIGGGE